MKQIIPLVGLYSQSSTRKDTYDLIKPISFPFPYFILSTPKSEYLIQKKVEVVIDCWKHKMKILHTGLIECYEGWYYGDNINYKGKKELLILNSSEDNSKITSFYLNPFTLKNHSTILKILL